MAERKVRLKVYGGMSILGSKQFRTIVAAPNTKVVAKLIGASDHYVRGYWSETGNAKEIEVAMSEPGVLFYAADHWSAEYTKTPHPR